MAANKYYVVWKGFATGVFDSWDEAQIQVSGYPDAQYRAYKTQEEAVAAFREGYDKDGLIQEVTKQVKELNKQGHNIVWDPKKVKDEGPMTKDAEVPKIDEAPKANETETSAPAPTSMQKAIAKKISSMTVPPPIKRAIAVDGACGGNPGPGEYRGVFVETGQELFHFGPIQGATNNIMEFLAIVHGLGFLEKQNLLLPIYSDSVNAQLWVRNGKCKTTIQPNEENEKLFELIERAENWLKTHKFRVNIYKWDTKAWGEIPADFGRK